MCRSCIILFLVGFLLIDPTALHGQGSGGTLTLDAYRARLASTRERLETGGDLAAVRADLARIRRVQLSGGEVLTVEPLLAGVDDGDVARTRLETALAQIDLSANDRTAQRMAALERASRRVNLRPTLWERFLRWLRDLLERILPDRSPIVGGIVGDALNTLIGWGVVVVGGTLLALLLSYWLRGILGSLLADAETRRRRERGETAPLTADEARQQASVLARAGNYREAVRRLFLAALLHLREHDLLHYDESQTNREVLANLEPDAPVRAHLAPVVETFDRVWYGVREPDVGTFDDYSREIEALMAAPPASRAKEEHRG